MRIGHFKGDSPSDLKAAAEAVGGGTFSQMRRPLLKASPAPALASRSDATDVNVLVYIVE